MQRLVDCSINVVGGRDRFAALKAALISSCPLVTCRELRVSPNSSLLLDSLVEELVVLIVLVGAQHSKILLELVVVEAVSRKDFAL